MFIFILYSTIFMLATTAHHVWLMILRLTQAIAVRSTHPIRPPPEPDSKLLREIYFTTTLFYQPVLSFIVISSADRYGIGTQWCGLLVLFWSWWSYFTAFLTVVMECTFGPPKRRCHYDPGLISRFRCAMDTSIGANGLYCGVCDVTCMKFWIYVFTSYGSVVMHLCTLWPYFSD
jgi:hypothetical protein